MMRALLAVAALLFLSPGVALAKDKSLDPAGTYVVIDIENIEGSLVKGVEGPGDVTLGRYDPEGRDIRGGELSPGTALPPKQSPHVPIRKDALVKTKGVRQYVVKIEPDHWVIEGTSGTAFSLGSLQFQAAPGEVIDLGVFKPSIDWAQGEGPKSMGSVIMGAMFFGSAKPKNLRPAKLDWHARGEGDLPLPGIIDGREVVLAEFETGATFGNYLGGLVNRIGGRAERYRELAAEQAALRKAEEETAAAAVAEESARQSPGQEPEPISEP